MLRFVIVVPITLVGLILLVVRYGGLKNLRAAARRGQEPDGHDRRRRAVRPPTAPPRRERRRRSSELVRRPGLDASCWSGAR